MAQGKRVIVQEFTKDKKLKSHKYYRIFEDGWDF
jgi:hypothetical protein